MAQVVKTRVYNTGDTLTATNYNDDRDEMIAGINSIDDSQISPTANISESKLNFSGSLGHTHDGSDGTKIETVNLEVAGLTPGDFVRVKADGTGLEGVTPPSSVVQERSFVFYAGGTLSVSSDISANPQVSQDLTATSLYAYVKTAPTGADLIINVKTIGDALIATLTIPAGNNSASTTSISGPNLTAGTVLKLETTQVGSTVAGADLTATLQTETPTP